MEKDTPIEVYIPPEVVKRMKDEGGFALFTAVRGTSGAMTYYVNGEIVNLE